MEFIESHSLNHWQIWTPLIGWLIIYIGLNIRITKLEDNEE